MTRYDLSDGDRRRLVVRHRAVQAAIAAVANRKLGRAAPEEGGIHKYEGGVRAGGREIAIKRDSVVDDCRRGGEPTVEERAVAEAIAEVAAMVRRCGPQALAPFEPRMPAGDPLRAMLDCGAPERPAVAARIAGWLRRIPARLTALLRPWPALGR